MGRAPEARDPCADAGKRVRARGTGEAHGRSRGVLLVVGMEDEDFLHRIRNHRVHFILLARGREHHVQEVLGKTEFVLRVHERLADRVFVSHGGERRHFRDHAHHGEFALSRIVDVERIVVERAERGDRADHDGHRVCATWETAIEEVQLLMHHRVAVDGVLEPFFLAGVRQVAVVQQVGCLQEVRFRREVRDVIAAIAQDAFVTVDIGDFGIAARGRHEARVEGEMASRSVELADVDNVRALDRFVNREFDRCAALDRKLRGTDALEAARLFLARGLQFARAQGSAADAGFFGDFLFSGLCFAFRFNGGFGHDEFS